MHAVFVYSLEPDKATQITDGMSDAVYPVFDKNGKYLYFTASTDVGLAAAATCRPQAPGDALGLRRGSQKDVASPLAPESDEEKAKETR